MITKPRKLRKLEDENWLVIPNTNNRYQISDYGRIKSFALNKTDGQILKPGEIKGFKLVQLNTDKYKRKFFVHKLVAQVWLPLPSVAHTYVTHLDGIMTNNHISNLEWHTKGSLIEKHREYAKQRMDNSKRQKFRKNTKLEETDIELLKTMLQKGVKQAKIAKLFRISEMQVTRIKRGENWGYVKVPDVED